MKNLLSFGPNGTTLEFEPLTVLIGPNGAGKTNLIEVVALLRSAPDDLTVPIRNGGGIGEWLWKGEGARRTAEIQAIISNPNDRNMSLSYKLAFAEVGQTLEVTEESLETKLPYAGQPRPYIFFSNQRGRVCPQCPRSEARAETE